MSPHDLTSRADEFEAAGDADSANHLRALAQHLVEDQVDDLPRPRPLADDLAQVEAELELEQLLETSGRLYAAVLQASPCRSAPPCLVCDACKRRGQALAERHRATQLAVAIATRLGISNLGHTSPIPFQLADAPLKAAPTAPPLPQDAKATPSTSEPPAWFPEADRLVSEAFAQLAKLGKFKAYVHKRLDAMGVPPDPVPGDLCRIGRRLDWLEARLGVWGDSREPEPDVQGSTAFEFVDTVDVELPLPCPECDGRGRGFSLVSPPCATCKGTGLAGGAS